MNTATIAELTPDNTLLLVVDYQKKLFPLVFNFEELRKKAELMIRFARLVDLPLLLTEHYPDGLGRTVKGLRLLLEESGAYRPLTKRSFDCFGNETIRQALRSSGKKNIIICGIETHICVLQTLLSALGEGFTTYLLIDAVGSRDRQDHDFALMQAESAGSVLTTVETVMYQMVKGADHPKFKEFIRLVAPKKD